MFELIKSNKPVSGYKLIDKGQGVWQMRTPRGNFTGNFNQVMNYSVLALGFSKREIEIGREEMEKSFMNAAEYGIFKRFMWPFDLNEDTTRH
jgi:hypothetical protein